MKINIEKVKELMAERHNGNYNAFARATGINVALLYKMLNNKANAGLRTVNRLIDYLKQNGLNVEDYIFLP